MRHHALPETMTPETLAIWLVNNSKDTFTDTVKYIYSEEEIAGFEKESTRLGIHILELLDIKKTATDLLNKGSEEDIIIEIPYTPGLKVLKDKREALDRMVKSGFESEDVKIYGIPDPDGNMYYFTIEGELVADRTRKLSDKENHTYNGMFINTSKQKES